YLKVAARRPPILDGERPRLPGYLRRRERRRSARGFPPVWHVAQYCSDLVAKLTWRMTSPHSGHFSPVRPCTRMFDFLSLLRSAAASPDERSTASSITVRRAACSVAASSEVSLSDWRNGESLARCRASSE